MDDRLATISYGVGEHMQITLSFDGVRLSTHISIDGVPYHFERIYKSVLGSEYIVDNDPDYIPISDSEGYCYIIAPFSA